MNNDKKGLFITDDGQNLTFTFILVSSLFFVWAVCNGMIDVMDKHFQEELHLSKSQSAWVQFAHYLGYFLMSMPAGWLATKLGYKRGIIAGLLLVAMGGFWFIPATSINAMVHTGGVSPNMAFVAFLAGVCVIATGLTFLETIANPYTTVLGTKRYAATRINLAQSCNGVGWIFGPIIGSVYFYSKNEAGQSTGSQNLYIPYVAVAAAAIGIAVIFYFANVPDIKAPDDYRLDDAAPDGLEDVVEPVFQRQGRVPRREPGADEANGQLHGERMQPRGAYDIGRQVELYGLLRHRVGAAAIVALVVGRYARHWLSSAHGPRGRPGLDPRTAAPF